MVKAMQQKKSKGLALVRGVSDVGSAICWALHSDGFHVIAHEDRQPKTIRRRMAFCDALWKGEAALDGLHCVRTQNFQMAVEIALDQTRPQIALYTGPFTTLMAQLTPRVVIDARIQKHTPIERLKSLAPLTIGIGPSFQAGRDVDLVIESCWGDSLGSVIEKGSALAPVDQPPKLNGIGWDRFIRAAEAGRFETTLDIGSYVKKGSPIGSLNDKNVPAPISGYLRGLLYPGLSVHQGEKLCEIDPREEDAHFIGLAERPRQIAKGVLEAVQSRTTNQEIKSLKNKQKQIDSKFSENVSKIC